MDGNIGLSGFSSCDCGGSFNESRFVWYNPAARVLYPSLEVQSQKGLDMKILLIKDVYKLGRAGDVKKVADGYGRNYLLPQGFAVLATSGALKQVERIRAKAAQTREVLNTELKGVAEQIQGLELSFSSKAGETGKLYGSITTQMIADAIAKKVGAKIDHRQVESQPIRNVGEYKARVRLTIDLTPEVKVTVTKEGEAAEEKPVEKTKRAPREIKKQPAVESSPEPSEENTPEVAEGPAEEKAV